MTAIGTLTIDCSSLGVSDIVIDTEGFGTYCLDAAGLGRVGRTPRETFATPSPFQHGQARTSVVWDESSLPVTVRVQAASAGALDTAVTALEDALSQFVYNVTLAVSGVSKVYSAYPATWNTPDGLTAFERVTGLHEDLAITIPVYPLPS